MRNVRSEITAACEEAGFKPIYLADRAPKPYTISEIVAEEIARADCIVADVSNRNPNVFYEIGFAQAQGKAIFILVADEQSLEIPADIRGFPYITYADSPSSLVELHTKLRIALTKFRKSPQRHSNTLRTSNPGFIVDWDRLDPRDSENLLIELLTQMGYQSVDWHGRSRGIDILATLPKRDPDGFDYRELWLVSTGKVESLDEIIEMALFDRQYFYHYLTRHSLSIESATKNFDASPITFLVVPLARSNSETNFEKLLNKYSRNFDPRGGSPIRVRLWDQQHLTSLVYQYPAIGYKYFTDDLRSQVKFRKSPEQLYRENMASLERERILNRALQEERSKRITAERDAIWKDISFAAAHKVGNPIFAIEAGFDPLVKRVVEKNTEDALHLIEMMHERAEAAKKIIEQFKSLTKAQQLKMKVFLVRSILERACDGCTDQRAKCTIHCQPNLKLYGDEDRLLECIDELIANSCHFFDKDDHSIELVATVAKADELPKGLDETRAHILIKISDNGAGVPVDIKKKIFDSFFTSRIQGTGLGLALVRLIVERHEGIILETGLPGKGATFEVFLPKSRKRPKGV